MFETKDKIKRTVQDGSKQEVTSVPLYEGTVKPYELFYKLFSILTVKTVIFCFNVGTLL